MNTIPASLMVASFDHVVCIKINGRANFVSSVDLKKLVNELWDRGCSRFVFDLSECLTMDSTFLGVLSGIGSRAVDNKETHHSLELINPNSRIADTLENLGVAYLFTIRQSHDLDLSGLQPVANTGEASRVEVARTCLEAHEKLMDINPNNVPKFKDVTQFFAEDLKRIEGK